MEAWWYVWAFACALGVRIAFTRLLRRRLGARAQLAAYAAWPVLLFIGAVLVGISGMQMYGFDANDPRQMAGWWLLTYSPLGLPILFGAPVVLVVDAVWATGRWLRPHVLAKVR